MTLSWADGIALGDNDALDAAGHNRNDLAERVLRLFLLHALRDGFFHADMHRGNLKVAANGDIIAYDYGIMGHIDEYTRRVYAEILFGFIRRDYKRVAEVHFEAGYVPANQTWTSLPALCVPWASRSSAWTPRIFPWGGC